jgi:fucose permease
VTTIREFLGSKAGLVVCLVIAAVGVYLLWAHSGHVLYALPYLLLLACPLMHFFGHGHGHRHDHERVSGSR